MCPGNHARVLERFLVFVGAIVMVASCTSPAARRQEAQLTQVARDQEAQLTELHGVEVEDVMVNYQSQWLSLEAHLDPSLQSELATGPYLDAYGYAREGQALYDEPYWLVTTSVSVQSVRVLEYDSERFKAVACVTRHVDKLTTGGEELIEHLLPYESCCVYVFVREDDLWKLAGLFNMGDKRDWDYYAPSWLKEIIGEWPGE